MKRTIALLAACLGIAACTPAQYINREGVAYPTRGERQHTWSCYTPAGDPYQFHGYVEGLPQNADCDRVVA